jgi:hypothetical protein
MYNWLELSSSLSLEAAKWLELMLYNQPLGTAGGRIGRSYGSTKLCESSYPRSSLSHVHFRGSILSRAVALPYICVWKRRLRGKERNRESL